MTRSANATKNYTNTNGREQMESGCSALTATPVLLCPWASVAGRGRKTVTPTAEVRIVALPERWVRCLLDNFASTVVERLLDLASVWKLEKCPLRSQTLISTLSRSGRRRRLSPTSRAAAPWSNSVSKQAGMPDFENYCRHPACLVTQLFQQRPQS